MHILMSKYQLNLSKFFQGFANTEYKWLHIINTCNKSGICKKKMWVFQRGFMPRLISLRPFGNFGPVPCASWSKLLNL